MAVTIGRLTTDADSIVGSNADELVEVPSNNANLSSSDTLAGGGGHDVLLFERTAGLGLHYSNLTGVSGFEEFDFSAAATAVITLDDATILQSDTDTLRLTFDGDPLSLDLRSVTPGAGQVEIAGTGTVTLYDAPRQQIRIADGVDGTVIGGEGRDTIDGGSGNDSIVGGLGDDTLSGGGGGDTLSGGADQDRLFGGSGNDSLSAGDGFDVVSGGSGTDTVSGGGGSDSFLVSAGETLTVLDFDVTDPFERLDLRPTGATGLEDLAISSVGGNALVTAPGGTSITLTGVSAGSLGAGNFVFTGDSLVTLATGLSKAPDFEFTDAADSFSGTAADEVFEVKGNFGKLGAEDVFDGGGGIDTLRIWGDDRALSAGRLAGMSGIEVLDLSGAVSATRPLEVQVTQDMIDSSASGRITVRYGDNDVILLTGLADDADGVVLEGTGAVTLRDVENQGVTISDHYAGDVTGQNKNDVIRGGALDDTIAGSGGDDTLTGGGGDNVLSGGADADLLISNGGSDTVSGGTGTDRFVIRPGASDGRTVTITDFAGAQQFEYVDLSAFSGVTFDDLVIGGNSNARVILPDGTRVVFTGLAPGQLGRADFILDGDPVPQHFVLSDGADSLTGGAANDLFDLVGQASQLDATVDLIDGRGGIDTLRVFGEDRSLGETRLGALRGIEVIDLTAATGQHDLAIDDAMARTSDTGSITVRFGNDPIALNAGGLTSPSQLVLEGSGLVTLSSGTMGQMVTISDAVGGNVQAGNDATVMHGGAKGDRLLGDFGYDTLYGAGGDDTLSGGDSNDDLYGGAGDDTLLGGDGNDMLRGGAGANHLNGGGGFDQYIIEAGAQGTVLVDYNPRNFVERIDLTELSGVSSLSDLSFTDTGSNVRVTGAGLDITLLNVQASELNEGDFIFKGQDPLLFNVEPGTTTAEFQQLFDGVPEGATIDIAAGVYTITQGLVISRGDITVHGAGEGKTIFRSQIADSDAAPTILVTPDRLQERYGTLPMEMEKGSYTVQLPDVEALRAANPGLDIDDFSVGDLLFLFQPNDPDFLAASGNLNWNEPTAETELEAELYYLREFRSRIVSIDENGVATLADPSPFTFQADKAEVARNTFLSNVSLSDFTIEGTWGEPDPFLFEDTMPAWTSIPALEFDGVRDSDLSRITIHNPAATAFRWQRAHETTADHLTAIGAHNKSGASGYHFLLQESFDNDFTNLSSTDARHAVLFSSFNAEHYNNLHVLFSNRDINFHGSPDSGNTVVVDRLEQDYPAGSEPQWMAVHPGVTGLHPASTIEANDVTFKFARSGERSDRIVAHVDGGDIATGVGSDELIGQGGNDTLDGGEGNDTLYGGGGTDLLTGGDGKDDLRGGEGNDTLYGGIDNDVLRGGAGDDLIIGGASGDNLLGGTGRDTFLRAFGDLTDTIHDFEAGVGGDILHIRGTAYTRFGELQMKQVGDDVWVDFGPGGVTVLRGIQLGDLVPANFGFSGDSEPGQTIALKASEMLGVGTDRSDTFTASRAHMDSADFTVLGGPGYDRIVVNQSSLNADLGATGTYTGIEEFDLSAIETLGLVVDNPLVSQSNSSKLYLAIGDTGTPVLLDVGPLGRGKNVFIDGAREVHLTGEREHTVKSTDRVGTHIIGDDLRDIIYGAGKNDVIEGGGGNDILFGSAGEDTLYGGAGNDTLNGGPGSDIIHIDDLGDKVAESRRWDGHDTVIASVDFRMGRAHIEDLDLTGDAVLGAGNGLMNVITGNDQDNILDGGKNVDTLIGGKGDDTYLIRAPGDNAVELAGEGIDTVKAFRSVALDPNVENLFIQTLRNKAGEGIPNINGIGNDLDNLIVGNPYENTLNGMGGNDTLRGQGGADTFIFNTPAGPGNVDHIVDFAPGEDRILIEADLFAGIGPGNVTAAMFQSGTVADDPLDRVIYDRSTGNLWIDPDGDGAAGQTLLAVLDNQANVSESDFHFI